MPRCGTRCAPPNDAGSTSDEILEEFTAALEKMLKNIPLRRLGEPEEVAELVTLLANGRCEFVTGQVIPIAGGWA